MSRYVITKDGTIYDLKSKEISSIEQKDCWVDIFYYDREKGQYLEWDDNGGRSMDTIYKTEILNQSENLEELCDEFVCEWFDKEVNRYRHIYCRFKIGQSKELYRKDISLPPDVDFEIYAGIWVNDKGLTYVAKMDNDGKLVLV